MLLWQLIILKTKIITILDDYIRLVAMTLLALLAAHVLDLSGLAFLIVLSIGVAIDVHDIAMKFVEGKPVM